MPWASAKVISVMSLVPDEPLYIFGVLHDACPGSISVKCEGCGVPIYLSKGSLLLVEERDRERKKTIVVCVHCGTVAVPAH